MDAVNDVNVPWMRMLPPSGKPSYCLCFSTLYFFYSLFWQFFKKIYLIFKRIKKGRFDIWKRIKILKYLRISQFKTRECGVLSFKSAWDAPLVNKVSCLPAHCAPASLFTSLCVWSALSLQPAFALDWALVSAWPTSNGASLRRKGPLVGEGPRKRPPQPLAALLRFSASQVSSQ